MSKSNGAILTVSLLEEQGYDPLAFRFMCISSHYRKQLLFTYENLKQAENTLHKLKSRIASLKDDGEVSQESFDSYVSKFREALENDLNTSNALSVLCKDAPTAEIEPEIQKLIQERSEAKKNKDFAKADQIRDELLSRGIRLIDTREGTTYEFLKD